MKRIPITLPEIETQCVHVDIEELSEGVNVIRCMNDAEVMRRHGWLCAEHANDYYIRRRRPEFRDKDTEIALGIVEYEKRALRDSQRVVVNIGRTMFQYVR